MIYVRRLIDFLLSSVAVGVDDCFHSLYDFTKSYIDKLILESE